jgi:PAS domain S-box-containing protein
MAKQETRLPPPQPSETSRSRLAPDTPSEDELGQIQALNNLAKALRNNRNLGNRFQEAAQKARELTQVDVVFFCSVDRSADSYYISAVFGDTTMADRLQGLPVPAPPVDLGGDDCDIIHFGKQPSDVSPFADQIRQMGIATGMVTPLQVEDRHLGFLFGGNRKSVGFTKAQQSLLSLIGTLLTAEIHRKRSEKEHGRLETILEQAAETIIITDRDGVIQYVNPSFEAASGYKRQEVIGKRPGFLQSRRQNEAFYREMKQTLHAGNVWRGRLINRRNDGSFYELDATISPIRNDRGKITDYVSVSKDITQESLLRRQLHQAQKMEAIGTLAGGIAHDFNNLLMGIQGNVSLMRMEMPEGHTHQDRCKTIESYIHKGEDLTRQLLGVARNRKRWQTPTDISKLVESNLEMFARVQKEIRTHIIPDPLPCIAEVDPGQIDQVFLNLFVNAWHAMPQGGDLYVSTRLVSETGIPAGIADLKPGPYVNITIRDTGTGIDDTILDKIFDPFFTTKEKGRGTGLGLSSAYGIIKNHGGIIQVRSIKDRGATFEILLPASRKDSVQTQEPETPIEMGKGTILLVDDEVSVLGICFEMLKNLGYRVITASTGKNALAIYRSKKGKIDLVVLDIIMPGMRGEEVYDALLAIDPGVRVLLASGYDLEGEAKKLLSSSNVGFIQKPFSMPNLSRKVRQIIAP